MEHLLINLFPEQINIINYGYFISFFIYLLSGFQEIFSRSVLSSSSNVSIWCLYWRIARYFIKKIHEMEVLLSSFVDNFPYHGTICRSKHPLSKTFCKNSKGLWSYVQLQHIQF
jgi:hypothetical protein